MKQEAAERFAWDSVLGAYRPVPTDAVVFAVPEGFQADGSPKRWHVVVLLKRGERISQARRIDTGEVVFVPSRMVPV